MAILNFHCQDSRARVNDFGGLRRHERCKFDPDSGSRSHPGQKSFGTGGQHTDEFRAYHHSAAVQGRVVTLSPLVISRLVSFLVLAAALAPSPLLAQTPVVPEESHPRLFSTTDVWFGAAAAAGIFAAGESDRALQRDLRDAGGASTQQLSNVARPIGTATVLAPAVLLGVVAGLVFDRPGLTQSSVRIGAGIVVSAAACEVLKVTVGRARPYESPGDPDELHPFSGHDSFPSGHTTVAFAAATGLCREAPARWVPWVAYPLAGLCGWSRVHDDMHWASDVVAGAALGIWSAHKTQDVLRRRADAISRLSVVTSGGRHSERFALTWTY